MRRFIFFKGLTKEWISTDIVGGNRRLRAVWSPELAEELDTFHAIDAEAELTRILTTELTRGIAQQIDDDILNQLRDMVTEDEVRDLDILNYEGNLDTTAVIRELTRSINGGIRA